VSGPFCGDCGRARALHALPSDHDFKASGGVQHNDDLAPPSTPPQRPAIDALTEAKSARDVIRAALVKAIRNSPHSLEIEALLRADDLASENLKTALTAFSRT
jgi:hypothetical protein